MTLPATGVLTASAINIELERAGTAAFAINGTPERSLAEVPSGVITFANFRGKSKEVIYTVTADINQMNIQSLFSAGDWAAASTKVVVIPRGRTVYSNSAGTAAIVTGTGRGGLLRIMNDGNCLGGPGAQNGGTGGNVLKAQQSGVTVHNTFQWFSGGGGGGIGGQGGQGFFDTAYTASEGPIFADGPNDASSAQYRYGYHGPYYAVIWYGFKGDTTATSLANGGYTYYRGAFQYRVGGAEGPIDYYAISRTFPSSYRTYTTGGAGGAGGWGTGWSGGGSASGAAGSAGGTNSGNGGAGGAGGGWGVAGSAGATGSTGNYTGGNGGGAAGLAGLKINNPGNVTITSVGDMRGR